MKKNIRKLSDFSCSCFIKMFSIVLYFCFKRSMILLLELDIIGWRERGEGKRE